MIHSCSEQRLVEQCELKDSRACPVSSHSAHLAHHRNSGLLRDGEAAANPSQPKRLRTTSTASVGHVSHAAEQAGSVVRVASPSTRCDELVWGQGSLLTLTLLMVCSTTSWG